MKPSLFHGLLVLDKPGGVTSRAVVDRALRWFPRGTRMGHTGTLDPLATGVLVLCLGTATRLTEYVQRMDKTYRTRLFLGARSDTDDADGNVTPVATERTPDRDSIALCLEGFVGAIEQVPPAFSAAKVAGRRAYELARRGAEVSLPPRTVHVHGVDLLAYDYPHLDLEVRCGKGTYVRSLARDLGERLGCGALVETLRRTQVGPFSLTQALGLDADAVTARARLLPVALGVADLPRLTVSAADAGRLRQGQGLSLGRIPGASADEEVAVFTPEGTFVGVALADRNKSLLLPVKVLS